MSLLGQARWTGADLRTLLRHELLPFDDGAGRVSLDGPALTLAPDLAQPLSLILHELATNAMKYGALSVAQGRLVLRWSRCDGMVDLHWQELGGPPIVGPPTREGFGSTLFEQSLSGQNGGITLEWRPRGWPQRCASPLRHDP